MPTCVQCNSDEFELTDGHFYCIICSTQSQEVRQEETLDLYETGERTGHLVAITAARKKQEKVSIDYGRPWRTSEAFQFIIKEQVKAAINLGINKKIQGVVFKLWTAYLGRSGEAFCENAGNTGIYTGDHKLVRSRDLYPGTSEHPRPTMVRMLNNQVKLQENIKKLEENIKSESDGQEEESEDEDALWTMAMAKEEERDDAVSEDDNDEAGKGRDDAVYWKRKFDIKIMDMQLTLSFLHLGLLYTDNIYTAIDLVRYVTCGDIPYYGAVSLLPGNMKFSGHDAHTFTCPTMTVELLLKQTGRLAWFLDIKELPQSSVHALASKYIVVLNLPGVLHGPLKSFLDSMETFPDVVDLARRKTLKNQDAISVAYVIALLQVIFSLDDDILKYTSEVGKELKDILHSDIFIWSDWFSWLDLKAHTLQAQHSQCITHKCKYLHQLEKKLESRISVGRKLGHRSYKPATMEAIQKPLDELLEKLEVDTELHTRLGDPMKSPNSLYDHTFLDDYSNISLNATGSNEESNHMHRLLQKDFRKQSLEYILQPDVCIAKLSQIGKDEVNHADKNQPEDLYLLHDPRSPQKRKNLLHCDQADNKRVKFSSEVDQVIDKLRILQQKLHNTRTRWKLNEIFEMCKLSLSYYTLVMSGSHIVGCSPKVLHSHVLDIQGHI